MPDGQPWNKELSGIGIGGPNRSVQELAPPLVPVGYMSAPRLCCYRCLTVVWLCRWATWGAT